MKRRIKHHFRVVLGFLLFGVILGFIENVIAFETATSLQIDFRAVLISFLVVVPFAAISELIVDRIDLIPRHKRTTHGHKHLAVFLEFFIFGLIMGIVEDLIVIGLVTGAPITVDILLSVACVTLPFAIFGELIVDRKDWITWIKTESKRSGIHLR